MSQEPPTLEYAKAGTPSKPRLRWWPSMVSIVLTFLFLPSFARTDGYLHPDGFILTVPAFGLACYGWISNRHKNLLWRALLMVVTVLVFFPLLQNILDVLWLWFRI